MNRISRNEMCMGIAAIVAIRSTCLRKKVGAVISRAGRILSTGYAGAPSGFPHCSTEICNLEEPCIRTIHAEMNAIAFAARYGVSIENSILYVTYSPCLNCAKVIINSGIKEVFYMEAYRDTYPIDLLKEAGILVEQHIVDNESWVSLT